MFFVFNINMFLSMILQDMYREVVSAVCRTTGIDEYSLFNSNSEEAVDARYLLIHFLSQKLTDIQISHLTKLTRQAVNKIRNNFQHRIKKWSVATNMQQISDDIETL